VSSLTLGDLLAADPESLHRSAIAWSSIAADLDRAYEAYARARARTEAAWPAGSGAQAAVQCLAAQGHELSSAHNPARRIAYAIEHHAYAMGEMRLRAAQTVDRIERTGYLVDRATGEVIAADAATGPETEVPQATRISGMTHEIVELVDRARALDARTTTAIRANEPVRGYGFGGTLAHPIGREAVARQLGRSAAAVHAWWQDLTPEQQEQVLRDDPDIVGWLDGVPAVDRDRANRSGLGHQLAVLAMRDEDLTRQLNEALGPFAGARHDNSDASFIERHHIAALRAELAEVRGSEAGLRAVRDKLGQVGDRALLMGIDGGGDGRAIVSLGDPDRAQHTAVFVPGINTDLLDIGGDVDRIDNLQRAAQRLTPPGDDVAVIYWLGYDTPGTIDALGYGSSRAGSHAFTPFVDALRATHEPDSAPYHVTAVGHSYGTTVIAESALAGSLRVDDIIAAGSPGMHTDRAAKLHIDPRHVWGGLARGDLIGGGLGDLAFVHGEEPTDKVFGGNRFAVDTRGHSAYWTAGSASLRNQAAIIVGRYDLVGYDFGSAPAR
jgi:hypothetical protein